ncbi:unnamed protein product [Chrysoparadoxa australica]
MRHACVVGALTAVILHGSHTCQAFRYDVQEAPQVASEFSFSERFMFGTDQGPPTGKKGESKMVVDLEVGLTTIEPAEFHMNALFYRSDLLEMGGAPRGIDICQDSVGEINIPSMWDDMELQSVPLESMGFDFDKGRHSYGGPVKVEHDVLNTGLHYVLLQVCPHNIGTPSVQMQGELMFKNPYGYLPGSLYGLLPFQLIRTAAFLVFDLFYVATYLKHRKSALPLHAAILCVLTLATLEAAAWLVAYWTLNTTGKPMCCPFPGVVILGMTLDVFLKTVSRLLMLIVCLGYGIVRPQLTRKEKVGIAALTVTVLVTGIIEEISRVGSVSHLHVGDDETEDDSQAMWALPALLANLVFLGWIYSALVNMLQALKDNNESFKLQMYQRLTFTVSVFSLLYTSLTLAVTASATDDSSNDQREWQWLWVFMVSWEVLNFTVIAAVSTIWRPTSTSQRLAYSQQLATSEEEAAAADEPLGEGGIELQGVGRNAVAHSSNFTIMDDDEEDEEDPMPAQLQLAGNM